MQTLIAQSITCHEHGISSGLFKVSCLQNLPQPAVPPGPSKQVALWWGWKTQGDTRVAYNIIGPSLHFDHTSPYITCNQIMNFILIGDLVMSPKLFVLTGHPSSSNLCNFAPSVRKLVWCKRPWSTISQIQFGNLCNCIWHDFNKAFYSFTHETASNCFPHSLSYWEIQTFFSIFLWISSPSSNWTRHLPSEVVQHRVICRWNSIRCEVRCAINIAHHYGSVGVNLYCTKQY